MNAPRIVAEASDDGTLHFENGTSLSVPTLAPLKDWPRVREMLLRNGVEVDPAGETWVALDVRSFCGNCPRESERHRVPLDLFLAFLADPEVPRFPHNAPVTVLGYGLSISDWLEFENWCRAR